MEKLLRFEQIVKLTGLSRTTLWRLEKQGQFPKRVKLSTRAVAWRETEVHQWIAERQPKPP